MDTHVLREIDLEVEPGEMVSLVGASGTGKSTLLRIIAGLEEANAGRITYAGQPLSAPQTPGTLRRAGAACGYCARPHPQSTCGSFR